MKWKIALLALLAVACKNKGGGEKNASQASPALQAEVFVVHPEVLNEEIVTSGSIVPNEEVELKAEVNGRLLRVGQFSEGSIVAKGTLLFQIDDREFRAQRHKINVQLDQAKNEFQRNSALLKAEAISREAFDQSASVVAQLEAELSLLDIQIDKCSVQAPFSGRLGLRKVSEGAFISMGQALTSLVLTDPLKIEFEIPEHYAGRIKPGQEVWAVGNKGRDTLRALVYATESRIDPASRNLKVRALASQKDPRFIPGAFVQVKISLGKVNDALMIPSEAMVPELNGQKVFKLVKGKIQSQPVGIGTRSATGIQVLDGLEVGDTILTTGILQAKDGMQVKAVIPSRP